MCNTLARWIVPCVIGRHSVNINELRSAFCNPGSEFSPIPFWFWNDTLTEAELTRQIDDFLAHVSELRAIICKDE